MRIPVIPVQWLALFINAFAAAPHTVAGADAMHPARATRDQPDVAAGVSEQNKAKLADQLWSIFAQSDAADRAAALNDLSEQLRLTPVLDPAAQLHWATNMTDPTQQFAAACAACLLDAVRTLGWARLGTCDGTDCVDVYIDHAARNPRRYCSSTCSNRGKIRAYRARQAQ